MADYPSTVMYDAINDVSGIKNIELAHMLMNEEFSMGGKTMGERMQDRSRITRYLKKAPPGMYFDAAFSDFVNSAQMIATRTIRNMDGAKQVDEVFREYSGIYTDRMAAALEADGQSPYLYRNTVDAIIRRTDISDADRLSMLILLLIVTGGLGYVERAVEEVEAFSSNLLASAFRTEVAEPGGANIGIGIPDAKQNAKSLVLLRMVGNVTNPRPYRLSRNAGGTVIGRRPSQSESIDDVDSYVSADHLRVWLGDDGRWLAEGMDSTNGTVLVSGRDGSEKVVEPPRNKRKGWNGDPVEINPGDVLRLADATEFLVLEA